MRFQRSFVPTAVLVSWLAMAIGGLSNPSLSSGDSGAESSAKPEPKPAEESEEEAAEKPEKEADKPSLSPEMAALRDRIRQTILSYYQRPMNTRDHTAAEILQNCLAFGCDATVRSGSSATAINGIGCLCWNYSCAGYQLLQVAEKGVVARVGHGLQEKPGQFLAVLAQSAVPADYEIRIGEASLTVRDLVEAEKLDCRAGADLSQKLVGLAFYLDDEEVWKNGLGEEWSIEEMVSSELDRKAADGDSQATDRLMALSFALAQRLDGKRPVDGEFARADEFLRESQQHVLKLQNSDGSWHPAFFAYQGTSRDTVGVLNSTGRIIEWLAYSLPQDRLHDQAVVRSVSLVANLLNSAAVQQSSGWATLRGVGATMHALHALAVFDKRAYPKETTGAEEKKEGT